ncbi:MAG TPA: acyl-CoA thioesterase/bile acid-CoA:amino acid N-acyltransferase family protein [Rhizomicrobium sp.]
MLALLAATGLARAGAAFSVTPGAPLVDERLAIALSGLPPSRTITITSDTRAQDGLNWRARIVRVSDANGRIDLGADAMRLFWSPMPAEGPPGADRAFFAIVDYAKPVATRLEARDGRTLLAATSVARGFARADVGMWPMANGVLYAPNDGHAHPGVLVIGGSDGGLGAPGTAMLFASHGYAALSLAYFGAKGLPQTLERVPMETFAKALAWMRCNVHVDTRFLAIYGESRGTEPALWIAARDGHVSAVIARSPSFAFWGGVGADHLPGDAAWTLHGKALPYIPNRITVRFGAGYLWDRLIGTPVRQSDLFLQNIADFGPMDAVAIPVERIRAPILLLAGRDDAIWPSYPMALRLIARRGHRMGDELVAYPAVGHPIPYGWLPSGGERSSLKFAVGGTQAGTAVAEADAWPRLLAFLAKVRDKNE